MLHLIQFLWYNSKRYSIKTRHTLKISYHSWRNEMNALSRLQVKINIKNYTKSSIALKFKLLIRHRKISKLLPIQTCIRFALFMFILIYAAVELDLDVSGFEKQEHHHRHHFHVIKPPNTWRMIKPTRHMLKFHYLPSLTDFLPNGWRSKKKLESEIT